MITNTQSDPELVQNERLQPVVVDVDQRLRRALDHATMDRK